MTDETFSDARMKARNRAARDSKQDVGGRDGRAKRTSRRLADFFDRVSAALRASRNFSGAVKFDVGRQVVGKIDTVAIGQTVLQSELIGSGVYLTKIVDAGIFSTSRSRFDEVWKANCNKTHNDKKNARPSNDIERS
jgi:hypothetical protein